MLMSVEIVWLVSVPGLGYANTSTAQILWRKTMFIDYIKTIILGCSVNNITEEDFL